MPKVSVIIPVYNTEKYLVKCLESVCQQTLKDIEIICVNDCSPDNSLQILQEYAEKDERVKIIDFNENKGAASARNAGIEAAAGEYVAFLDSDDYIDLDFYEKLYCAAAEANADCAKGNYKDAVTGYVDPLLNQKIEEYQTNFAYAYCSAIFKRDVLQKNGLRFPEVIDMEDPVFTIKFALLMNKIVIVNDACIHIVKRENSLTSGIPTFEKIKAKFNGLNVILDIVNNASMPKESYAYVLAFWFQQTFVNSLVNKNSKERAFIVENIIGLFSKIKYKEIFINELMLKDKILTDGLKNNNTELLINYGSKSNQRKLVFLSLRDKLKSRAKPKISVIIPVYNAENYLERCLDSVCGQTLKDIEILCINDCSTDNSLEILNRYAQKDSRIFVVDCKVNGGESRARNLGLEKANGGFIAFVDNDDKIDLDFYEKLYRKAKETNADIVKGNVIITDYDGNSHQGHINPKLNQLKNKWFFHSEWWSAIYRTTIIKNNEIRLPEGYILGGDVLFLNEVLYYANKFEFVDNTAYHWIRRENSGESAVLSKEKILSALTIYDKIQTNINTWYAQGQIDDVSYDAIIENCLWLPGDYIFRNEQAECKKLCAEYYIKYYQNCKRKNIAEKYLQEQVPYLFLLIINKKKEELYNKILMIKDSDDLQKKNTLARLRINTKKNTPKVSVIIPVYNVERYLKRCLDSVCNQTLKDIEIICVNDCSPDNSLEILTEYAQKDNRIKVINFEQNQGVSAARNKGIEEARSEYIGFVDADDYVDLDFYEKLYTKAKEVGADIVKANAEIHKIDNTRNIDLFNNKISNYGKFCFTCFFTTAIYSRKMLLENDIKFPEGYCLGEDVYFLSCAVAHANTVDFINNTLYYYIRREGSADSKLLNEKQVMSVVKIYDMLTDNFNTYISVKQAYEFAYFYWYRSLFQILKNNSKYSDILFQYLIRLYEKCLHKNELLLKLQNVFGKIESDFIKNGDKDKLIEYYSKYNTEQKRRIAALRGKIALKK